MRVLSDVNLLLAVAYRGHSQNVQALKWLDTVGDDSVQVCRMAQTGFLRLLTTPAVMGVDVHSMQQAWRAFDKLVQDARFSFCSEPLGIQQIWRALCPAQQVAPKKWVDTYLAAFAIAAGLRLVTFDRGFGDFDGLDLILLGQATVHEQSEQYDVSK